jgi:type II secretory ATPase GspE/PulE/Tfp pilus assembly ATPase PilB-like protein
MYISESPDQVAVEKCILRVFAQAVSAKCSDIHFSGKLVNGKFHVFINIRTQSGFTRYAFDNQLGNPAHFETKLLQLSNNTIGGTQSEIISARFSMDFPNWWAKEFNLCPHHNEAYKIDIRVQFQKTYGGFSIVCRILDQQRTPFISEMGLSRVLLSEIRRVLNEPSGLILVSGPTGSGKTTLLNAMLSELNDGSRSIFTIENPVEFRLRGDGPITQVQTHGQVTFAAGLRSALRSDPDVILIGEIRDSETMEVALQAAQTGHLVLATIHASSATQTIGRMLDLTGDKIRDAYRVADSLKMVIAQRLITQYAKEPKERALSAAELEWLNLNGLHQIDPFVETQSTLKLGVKALLEAICIDHKIQQIIRSKVFDMDEVYKVAKDQLQYESLAMAGLRCVQNMDSKIKECMNKLDSQISAGQFKSLRTQLSKLKNQPYPQIESYIDAHFEEPEIWTEHLC